MTFGCQFFPAWSIHSIKISTNYFVDVDKVLLKLKGRDKRPRIDNTVLRKDDIEGLALPDFKIQYKEMDFQEEINY